MLCQDCDEEFLFSTDQQRRYKQLRNEDPKRCYKCTCAKKARFFTKRQAQGSDTSQDKPKAGMPDGAQAQAAGDWVSGGPPGGSDGWDSDGKGQGQGQGKGK